MGKTYLNTVKYQIVVKFEIKGIVDKHDIIGAVFGQSEGLIGEDMDLRELQKGGKIGRIEIEDKVNMGNTEGMLIIPSSMDMVQTSLLAAAVEAVDKVGPCESHFETLRVEDVRSSKRDLIKKRAEELLKQLSAGMPESRELAEEIRDNKKSAEIIEWGPENLPAGPEVDENPEMIIVEGRADVLNLLRNNVKNVIGMNGTKIPDTLMDLCRSKTVTVFIDGDRGGELNFRKLRELAKVDFVVRAPDGKEVEELTRKEIEAALRRKIPADDFGSEQREPYREYKSYDERKGYDERPRRSGMRTESRGRFGPSRRPSIGRRETSPSRGGDRRGRFSGGMGSDRPYSDRRGPDRRHSYERRSEPRDLPVEITATPEESARFGPVMQQVRDSLNAVILDSNNNVIMETGVRDLLQRIRETSGIEAVVFDGIITKRLVEEADKAGIKYVVGVKKGKIENSGNVKIITL